MRLLLVIFIYLASLLAGIEADMNVTPWSPISPLPTPTLLPPDGVQCQGRLCIE